MTGDSARKGKPRWSQRQLYADRPLCGQTAVGARGSVVTRRVRTAAAPGFDPTAVTGEATARRSRWFVRLRRAGRSRRWLSASSCRTFSVC
jgi:hypothetical protein